MCKLLLTIQIFTPPPTTSVINQHTPHLTSNSKSQKRHSPSIAYSPVTVYNLSIPTCPSKPVYLTQDASSTLFIMSSSVSYRQLIKLYRLRNLCTLYSLLSSVPKENSGLLYTSTLQLAHTMCPHPLLSLHLRRPSICLKATSRCVVPHLHVIVAHISLMHCSLDLTPPTLYVPRTIHSAT
jgi:hypothetical protein